MKKLLIFTGDLATGKSTFARELSRRFHTPMLSKDEIKEILGDTVGFTTREENRKLSIAAVELMTYLFRETTELGGDLIVEANFRTAELTKLADIAREHDYAVLTLVFRADNDVLYKRFMNRIENEHRHPVHQSAGLTDREKFDAYIGAQRAESVPGETLTVNADDFSYFEDSALLTRLEQFLS